MDTKQPAQPITIMTSAETIDGLDAIAASLDRSRDEVVNEALETFLATKTWQVGRIEAGLAAAREGRVRRAEDVFETIAGKHGW